MKKSILGSLMAVLASSVLMTNIALADAGLGEACPGNLVDSNKHVVRDGSGQCVQNSSWSKENACKECNPELFPEPVAEAPSAPPPPPQPTYEKVTISATALFDFNKAVLKPEGRAAIHDLDEAIKTKGAQVVDINVIGHTDSVGPEEYNQQLSIRRATAVKDFMVSEGIDAGIIDVSGKGESNPVADNGTKEGRAMNRRVEIHIGANAPQ